MPLGLGLGLLAFATASGGFAAEFALAHQTAAAACEAADDGRPHKTVAVVGDDRGASLVWLTDADTNLWLCSADAEGHVYALSMIFDDLLKGAGAKLLPPVSVDRDGKPVPPADPLAVATNACQAYLGGEGGTVLADGPDGLKSDWVPGYFVFLGTKAGETFLCDATANAQVWVFARIGKPLGGSEPVS